MIIYTVITRGTIVLSDYSQFDGDFPEITKKIILKSP